MTEFNLDDASMATQCDEWSPVDRPGFKVAYSIFPSDLRPDMPMEIFRVVAGRYLSAGMGVYGDLDPAGSWILREDRVNKYRALSGEPTVAEGITLVFPAEGFDDMDFEEGMGHVDRFLTALELELHRVLDGKKFTDSDQLFDALSLFSHEPGWAMHHWYVLIDHPDDQKKLVKEVSERLAVLAVQHVDAAHLQEYILGVSWEDVEVYDNGDTWSSFLPWNGTHESGLSNSKAWVMRGWKSLGNYIFTEFQQAVRAELGKSD